MTVVQCETAVAAQAEPQEEASRRMIMLMRRLDLDTDTLLQLPPSEVNLLRYALDEQLRAVEEAEALQGAIALRDWKDRHPLPQPITGPSPGMLAARGQRPVGTR